MKVIEMTKVLSQKRMWINLLLGFSAGLPIMLVYSTVKIWSRRAGIDLGTVGLLGLTSLPYSFNFLFGPFLDRFSYEKFGRRRTWLLAAQLGLVTSLLAVSFCRPETSMSLLAGATLCVALFGALQDVAIDAYRREILPDEQIGMGASLYVYGYRFAMLVASGGGLWLVDPETANFTFPQVFMIMAGLMGVGIVTTFLADEPVVDHAGPTTLKDAVIKPLQEFFARGGVKNAFLILGFIFMFKFGDALAGTMLGAFYVDMGYSNKVIAEVTKGIGFFTTMIGLGVGSLLIVRLGIMPCLIGFGFLQSLSTALFSLLTVTGIKGTWWGLGLVVGFEDFSSGLGTTALISYMATMTDKKYTATQYALFASLAALGKTLFGGGAGFLVQSLGYQKFFIMGSLLALPGLYLAYLMNKKIGEK